MLVSINCNKMLIDFYCSIPHRKPKETNDTAPSDSPPGKAASKGAKVKTQRAARKRSTPASVASTSYDVAPTPRPTQPTEETHSTSSTASPTHTQVHLEQTSEHSRLCSDTAPITPLCPAEVRRVQWQRWMERHPDLVGWVDYSWSFFLPCCRFQLLSKVWRAAL